MLQWALKLLLLAATTYALFVVYVFFMQARLLYYPNMPGRALEATPQAIGLRYEDVELVAEDGIRLHGWFIPALEARATVLFFHGNAGNISHRLQSIELFNDFGLNVFIFDYRGYGLSEGKPTEKGTYRDAEAAWRYLTETRALSPEEIIVFGRSLGGSVAAWIASRYRPAALIVESTFSSVPAMGQRLYPFLPVRWLSRFRYETAEYVKRVTAPVLVVHSPEDEIIPFAEGESVYAVAREPKQFLRINGGHNEGFWVSGAAYRDGLRNFIDTYALARY